MLPTIILANKIIIMKNLKLLHATGVLCLLFAVGHITFPLMPYWYSSLDAMEPDMKYIFLSLHYVTIAFLSGMGIILTFQTIKLFTSPIRNSVLLMFSSLFVIRTITEFVLWKAPMPQAAVIVPLCVFPVLVFFRVIFKETISKVDTQNNIIREI